MSLSHSSLRYGLATLFLFAPNIAFAEFDPLGGMIGFLLTLYGIVLFIFITTLYFCNKNGGNAPQKVARVLIAIFIYILMSGFAPLFLEFFIHVYCFLISSSMCIENFNDDGIAYLFYYIFGLLIPAFLAPVLAHKIIK